MKQVIWVFGESATGKKTFIEHLLKQNDIGLLEALGLENKTLDVSKVTILSSQDYAKEVSNYQERCQKILNDVGDFLGNSEKDVLLIKGQRSDIDIKQGNTLNHFMERFSDIERVILLLEVSDLELLYQRIVHKDWWQENPEKYEKLFPRKWLTYSVKDHEKMVLSYEMYGFHVTRIDTTNGYLVMKEERKWEK